jgi:hypothetical protein|tara:strand:+ start:4191 stop:4400 length:210 start_codon:yes stop_codon:yes gene_type:complete
MEKLNSLISKINSLNLNDEQYTEIYKILKKENIKIMKNNNGAFVNLSNIEPKVIKELEDLINYINNQEI